MSQNSEDALSRKAGIMARLNSYPDDYVVFDLETTGLYPEHDEIIEISGIKVRSRQIQENFSTLVNPGRPIPSNATKVNGITDKMVQDAPSPGTALEAFLAFAGDDILIGHNIHSFDMKFLQAGAVRTLRRKVVNDYVDTLSLARNLLPLARFRLTDLAAYFHIDTQGAHRALNDCVMNQLCYEKMHTFRDEQLKSGSAQTAPRCPKCGAPLVRRNGKFGAFWGCAGFPSCRYTKND
jgi:DNA polymerase-3 subunit epsilon